MPAVLVEMGFLSNAAELRKLSSDDYQEKLARRIAEGILEQILYNFVLLVYSDGEELVRYNVLISLQLSFM